MKIQIPQCLGLTPMFGLDPILPAPCDPDGLPAERCLGGAGASHATGIRRPLQPPVAVCSNPATLMHKNVWKAGDSMCEESEPYKEHGFPFMSCRLKLSCSGEK
jgi:hypothetical protein